MSMAPMWSVSAGSTSRRRGHHRDRGGGPRRFTFTTTGLHVSTNGRALAALLKNVVSAWPVAVRELANIGHGCDLLARSAHFYGTSAGHHWPKCLRYMGFLGTPHHGSALECVGNYATLLLRALLTACHFARIARSAGITDMRYSNLVDEDWQGIDRFQNLPDRRRMPLPGGVRCFAIAASKDVVTAFLLMIRTARTHASVA